MENFKEDMKNFINYIISIAYSNLNSFVACQKYFNHSLRSFINNENVFCYFYF